MRAVEPRGPHHHGVEPGVDRREHGELGVHLGTAVRQVRVVRLVVAEAIITGAVRAERAVRRHVDHAADTVTESGLHDIACPDVIDRVELVHRRGRMDDARGVDQVDGAVAEPVEEPVERAADR